MKSAETRKMENLLKSTRVSSKNLAAKQLFPNLGSLLPNFPLFGILTQLVSKVRDVLANIFNFAIPMIPDFSELTDFLEEAGLLLRGEAREIRKALLVTLEELLEETKPSEALVLVAEAMEDFASALRDAAERLENAEEDI